MDVKEKADFYFVSNAKFFPPERIPELKERFNNLSDSQFLAVSVVELKDPATLLIISVLTGTLGIDRFMLGDIGMGILKLLTCGVCFILWIIDMVNIQKMTKELNYKNMLSALALL